MGFTSTIQGSSRTQHTERGEGTPGRQLKQGCSRARQEFTGVAFAPKNEAICKNCAHADPGAQIVSRLLCTLIRRCVGVGRRCMVKALTVVCQIWLICFMDSERASTFSVVVFQWRVVFPSLFSQKKDTTNKDRLGAPNQGCCQGGFVTWLRVTKLPCGPITTVIPRFCNQQPCHVRDLETDIHRSTITVLTLDRFLASMLNLSSSCSVRIQSSILITFTRDGVPEGAASAKGVNRGPFTCGGPFR